MSNESSEFVPYGAKWQKEMMQFPKAAMIERCAEIIQTKETRIAGLEKALERIRGMTAHYKTESKSMLRMTMQVVAEEADAALKGGRDGK
jgi:hypothetical protein